MATSFETRSAMRDFIRTFRGTAVAQNARYSLQLSVDSATLFLRVSSWHRVCLVGGS